MAIVAPVAPSAVTPLPTPPSTSDPSNFDARADSFLGGLPTNQTQMNALGSNVYDNAVKTFDSATISKASADVATLLIFAGSSLGPTITKSLCMTSKRSLPKPP